MRPLADRVVITLDPEPTSKGLILLPQSFVEYGAKIGTVKSVGAKVDKVKVGDRVYVQTTYGGLRYPDEKSLDLIIKQEYVIGVLC